jgi:hypothetical protein
MGPKIERRRAERRADGNPAPEYLAILEICGGELRAGDRALLAAWRRAGRASAAGEPQRQGGDDAEVVSPAANDRRARTP